MVSAVDEHPWLGGTRRLYEAEIWDLLQRESLAPQFVQDRVDSILSTHGLARLPAERITSDGGALVHELGLPSIFNRCLHLSFSRMDRFARIVLAWLLFVQTEPAQNAHIRVVIEETVDNLLDQFFADFLVDKHLDYYDEAIGVLLRTRLDLSAHGISGYGNIETIGAWPVVPSELVGKLSRKNFGFSSA